MKILNGSRKSIEVMAFQLPFNGLGISLKTCAEAAEEMNVCYNSYTSFPQMFGDTEFSPVYIGLSGYDLQVTLGQEIRGR
ncbi:hypothetical protein [Maridesulfovibrio frigidus]|uniref:hypothetical protein n=1 Tax=Maridesulfovibrio frigidus TaxID=340956 RepID=UPI0004E118DF|nr:hypothetical protein [Maridesulfovibrio frigidus]